MAPRLWLVAFPGLGDHQGGSPTGQGSEGSPCRQWPMSALQGTLDPLPHTTGTRQASDPRLESWEPKS